jgi:hypothetical protein
MHLLVRHSAWITRRSSRRVVAAFSSSSSEGWLPGGGFRLLADAEAWNLPYAARLSAFEDWLRAAGATYSDLLELRDSSIRDGDGAVVASHTGATRGQGVAGYARRDFSAGTVVVELPMACLIAAPAAKATALGELAEAAAGVDDNDGNLFLALALLDGWARQQDLRDGARGGAAAAPFHGTFHGPYLDIVPRRLPHMPLFWGDDELEKLLGGSPLLGAVRERRAAIVADWEALQEEARRRRADRQRRRGGAGARAGAGRASSSSSSSSSSSPRSAASSAAWAEAAEATVEAEAAEALLLERATASDFVVAEMSVASRAFLVAGAGRGGRSAHCMVPLADMLNTALPHTCDVDFTTATIPDACSTSSGGTSTRTSSGSNKVFRMTALRDIAAEEQVHDSYGYKSNDRYLLNYGFSLEHNVTQDGSCPNEVPLMVSLQDVLDRQDSAGTGADDAGERRRLRLQKALLWPGGDATAAIRVAVAAPSVISSADDEDDDEDEHDETKSGAAATTQPIEDGRTAQLLSLLRFMVADETEFRLLLARQLSGVVRPKRSVAMSSTSDDDDDDDKADEEEEEEEEEEEGLPGLELIPGRAALPKLATLPRLSARNESAAWAALESLCRAALDRYHTSLDDDEAALAPPALKGDNNALPMFSNAWNARVHVRGEKRILSHLRRVAMRQQREEERREGGGR